MKLIRVGVDLAKNVFQLHGVDRNEKAVWRRKLTRENWLKVLLETVEPGCEMSRTRLSRRDLAGRSIVAGLGSTIGPLPDDFRGFSMVQAIGHMDDGRFALRLS